MRRQHLKRCGRGLTSRLTQKSTLLSSSRNSKFRFTTMPLSSKMTIKKQYQFQAGGGQARPCMSPDAVRYENTPQILIFFCWASGSISLSFEVNLCAVVVVPSLQHVLSLSSLAVVYNCVEPGWNGRERRASDVCRFPPQKQSFSGASWHQFL